MKKASAMGNKKREHGGIRDRKTDSSVVETKENLDATHYSRDKQKHRRWIEKSTNINFNE